MRKTTQWLSIAPILVLPSHASIGVCGHLRTVLILVLCPVHGIAPELNEIEISFLSPEPFAELPKKIKAYYSILKVSKYFKM